ncbi:hypothetical protein T11_2956 [Trichinella zimbabwensis]|uniref:HTH psq-type domain-containing protein n=1 Tax=Trichinella zimbabwensis TaxID=268475 RepID=A0A0V1HJK5_9BILA|nr:hypothetical protein T11_2956 [Trichinella zimbabwensis]
MPPGHRRFTFVVVCARWRWRAFKMEKKEWRQITTAQKLQIIQTVDENPNIDIARMMKIPSSTLNRILAKWKTLESACNDENLSSRKQIQGGKFPELLLITFSLRQIE